MRRWWSMVKTFGTRDGDRRLTSYFIIIFIYLVFRTIDVFRASHGRKRYRSIASTIVDTRRDVVSKENRLEDLARLHTDGKRSNRYSALGATPRPSAPQSPRCEGLLGTSRVKGSPQAWHHYLEGLTSLEKKTTFERLGAERFKEPLGLLNQPQKKNNVWPWIQRKNIFIKNVKDFYFCVYT